MTRSRFIATALASLLLSFAAQAHEYQAGDLKIGHPWTRPTAAGQPAAAGYLKLQNTGGAADRLVGGSSPAGTLELHSMAMQGDVMRMRQIDAIDIPAGQTVELKPGGLHLMLTGLKAPLAAGTKVPATLQFEKAGAVAVEFVVGEPKGGAAPSAAHDHH
jgi:copper(I)-binding protein